MHSRFSSTCRPGEMFVKRRVGLRTEIIVNISFLVGAALLLGGFLLVKLTESELVAQRVDSVSATMKIVAGVLGPDLAGKGDLRERVETVLQPLSGSLSPEGWNLVDRDLTSLAASSGFVPDRTEILQVRHHSEPLSKIDYDFHRIPGFGGAASVLVSVPVFHRQQFAGSLQVRFSLADVRRQVASAQKLVILYALLYGTVLVSAGVYLLSRNVVHPVRQLMASTRQVAGGDLEQTLPLTGPSEISDLAGSFNTMVAALKESRLQSEEAIATLHEANMELLQAHQELLRSERMASVGHLAAGMAHEIGNPLGAVIGYLEILRGDLVPGPEKDLAERALTETGRIDRLVRDLLDYAAPSPTDTELIDPAVVLREARDILVQQGAFAALSLTDELPSQLPKTSIAGHKLLQVFVNLLLNARDACGSGGTIGIAGGSEPGWVWLSISDTGAGMSREIASHIFDPFYTTKAPGSGRGLGLSVCHRVVSEAGGVIAVQSEPGRGSSFTVRLKEAESRCNET